MAPRRARGWIWPSREGTTALSRREGRFFPERRRYQLSRPNLDPTESRSRRPFAFKATTTNDRRRRREAVLFSERTPWPRRGRRTPQTRDHGDDVRFRGQHHRTRRPRGARRGRRAVRPRSVPSPRAKRPACPFDIAKSRDTPFARSQISAAAFAALTFPIPPDRPGSPRRSGTARRTRTASTSPGRFPACATRSYSCTTRTAANSRGSTAVRPLQGVTSPRWRFALHSSSSSSLASFLHPS